MCIDTIEELKSIEPRLGERMEYIDDKHDFNHLFEACCHIRHVRKRLEAIK